MTILIQPTYQILIFGPQSTSPFSHFTIPGVDAGSSISGGRFTERGWVPSRVISRQEKNVIIDGLREEARRKLAEDRELTTMGRAERDMRVAQEEYDNCEGTFNRNATKANYSKQRDALEQLEAARDKVSELNSIEYIERLWADYYAAEAEKKAKRGRN